MNNPPPMLIRCVMMLGVLCFCHCADDTPTQEVDMTEDLSKDIKETTMDATNEEMVEDRCIPLTRPAQPSWIGWGNVQHPPSQTLRPGEVSAPIYGQLWIQGQTEPPGAASGARAVDRRSMGRAAG